MIYVGDTVSDIKACNTAGVKIIAACWGYQSRKRLAEYEPDFIAEKPSDVMKILENMDD